MSRTRTLFIGTNLVYSSNSKTRKTLKSYFKIEKQIRAIHKKRSKLKQLRNNKIFIADEVSDIYPVRL